MTGMTNKRLADLAEETADCIDTCGLTGYELEAYVRGMLHHVHDEILTGKRRRLPKPTKGSKRVGR